MSAHTATATAVSAGEPVLPPRPGLWRRLGRTARAQPVGTFGLFLTLIVLVIVIFGPMIATADPNKQSGNLLAPPSAENWFGTDEQGRDYFSRVMTGGRVTVTIAVLALALGTVAGTVLGMVSAYFKPIDLVFQRLIDAILALPGLFLILLFITVFGKDVNVLIRVLALVVTPPLIRIARASTLSTLTNPYVEAAEVMGASGLRIILRHVLPNIAPTIGVIFAVGLGNVMLITGSLGFLGLGEPAPSPEWGRMISESREFLPEAWWYAAAPGMAIFLVVMGFNLLGDGLRDVLDPRLRRAPRHRDA